MRFKKQGPVRVELVGGLGNQLFGFFAGAYLSQKIQVPLVYHFARKEPGETKHFSSLESLDLGIDATYEHRLVYVFLLLARRVKRHLLKALGFKISTSERLSKLHTSLTVGRDPQLIECGPGFIIQGYFQTHEYFDTFSNKHQKGISLRRESEWYKEMITRLRAEKPVVIHVRRGDYTLDRNSEIGALSPQYFKTAIEEIRARKPQEDIRFWIFSDDIDLVRRELNFLDGPLTTWVSPPIESDAAESMMLMSLARTIVISNSTFSWWSAAISRDAEVIAPSKWFRKLDDPAGIIADDWKIQESQWMK